MHKRKSWTSLTFYVYVWPFIHRLYFIYARKNYATVEINPYGEFPLSRNFYARKSKFERGSTFTSARDLPYITSILFTRLIKFTCVRT